ncbi:MAG: hypothetical protein KM310_03450 [Clostridiales bacterium]|nr:hypothetical protein [Clostridiales bacterium]
MTIPPEDQALLTPLIMFLVWVFGQAGWPRKFLPLLALFFGIVGGLALHWDQPMLGVLVGISAAAAAVGFHSGIKNTVEGVRQAKG